MQSGSSQNVYSITSSLKKAHIKIIQQIIFNYQIRMVFCQGISKGNHVHDQHSDSNNNFTVQSKHCMTIYLC